MTEPKGYTGQYCCLVISINGLIFKEKNSGQKESLWTIQIGAIFSLGIHISVYFFKFCKLWMLLTSHLKASIHNKFKKTNKSCYNGSTGSCTETCVYSVIDAALGCEKPGATSCQAQWWKIGYFYHGSKDSVLKWTLNNCIHRRWEFSAND